MKYLVTIFFIVSCVFCAGAYADDGSGQGKSLSIIALKNLDNYSMTEDGPRIKTIDEIDESTRLQIVKVLIQKYKLNGITVKQSAEYYTRLLDDMISYRPVLGEMPIEELFEKVHAAEEGDRKQ
ncbi:MAG: hypothetical protein HQ579_07325 [Candidatus Omnitrophica bacterium]|nr:hypothetical protein [Candidatus Omnitrophota bacterium]